MKKLLGQEVTLMELDNKMVELGYYKICDDGVEEEILEDGCVYYLSLDNETSVVIDFEVTILADKEEESLLCSYIKVTEIN